MSDASTFNPFSPSFQRDPVASFQTLRNEDPVHQCPALNGWVVTRYEDTEVILTDRTRFGRIGIGAMQSEDPVRRSIEDLIGHSLANPDASAHTRQRRLLSKAFTPRAIEQLRQFAQAFVDDRLDAALARGELDIAREVARALSMAVICRMLGVPPTAEESFSRWAAALIQIGANPLMSNEQFAPIASDLQHLIDYMRRLVDERRVQPGDDLLSNMITAEEQGDLLSDDEVLANAVLLIAAGTETTQNAISYGILALLDHPGELARLQGDPSLLPQAVEEILRHSAANVFGTRLTVTEVELGGKRIPPGHILFWSSTAADHDPSAFPDPDRFDLRRKDERHLGFGVGAHYCIGAALARMEMQVAVGTMIRRLPGMRLKGSRSEIAYDFSMSIRNVPSLPVTW